jgi:serine/threonine protein kinase
LSSWHADIKPENIILVRGKYKLADPGFARFKRKAQNTIPQIRIHGGTDTYGAPEVSTQAAVHQTIDMWSLGCVFSMAATWVVMGYDGVRQYQSVREKALGNLLRTIQEDEHPLLVSQHLTAKAKPEKLDCFHDGTGALSEVTGWHALLKNSTRRTDPITKSVLDLVDDEMLLRDPHQRISSKRLCEQLKRIGLSSKKVIQDTTAAELPKDRAQRARMEDLLYEIDKEAATQIVEDVSPRPTHSSTAGPLIDRDALKVKLEHVALKKTSHRYETLPTPRAHNANAIFETPKSMTSEVMGTRASPERSETRHEPTYMEKRMTFRQSTLGQPSRSNTVTTAFASRKPGVDSRAHATQNVIQAREGMDLDRKGKGAALGAMWTRKKPRKDEYLSKHFKNRDIVSL